jgi:hypothetical protein
MENLELVFSAFITGLVSVITAIVILWLQRHDTKRRIINALYNEIDCNLNLAQKLLQIAEAFESHGRHHQHTYFDLEHFYSNSYEDFRRSGYFKFSGMSSSKQLLEEVYRLISSHNTQTDIIIHGDFPPRTRGYSDRIKMIIEKLQILKKELIHGK